MYVCVVKLLSSDVTVYSDVYMYEELEKCFQNMIDIPELVLLDGKSGNSGYYLRYNNSTLNKIIYSNEAVYISYPYEECVIASIILYALYPLMEKQNSQKYRLTCHAASVFINGNAVMLMGKEGSGKTSVAIELCRSKGAKLIANDLCVLDYSKIDEIKTICGTTFLTLRYESMKRNFPDTLFKLFANYESDSWTTKIKIVPKKLGIEKRKRLSIVRKFYIIHIDNTKKKLDVANANNVINKLYFNENFSRYIRNTCTATMYKNDIVADIPSFDCEEFFAQRKKLINYIFNNSKVLYLSGNLKDVTEYISIDC